MSKILQFRRHVGLALRAFTTDRSFRLHTQTKKTRTVTKNLLNVVLAVNKHNSLSQRVALELSRRGHTITVCEVNNSNDIKDIASSNQPDLILCPFLTKRVPEEVCVSNKYPCLIVHPGIEGDRGMSSIDWALKTQQKEWGVTILQAAEEMDSGDIWSTNNFSTCREDGNTATKASLYVNEVTSAAVKGCLDAVQKLIHGEKPRPLSYENPNVHGKLMPNMTKKDRMVSWDQNAEDIAIQVRMSDSAPGAVVRFCKGENEWTDEFRAFGAYVEKSGLQELKGKPGKLLGQRDNAVLVKCGEGALWLSHLKRKKLKLPSILWLNDMHIPQLPLRSVEIPNNSIRDTFQEIWTTVTPEGVCYVNFDFYNGAMSTEQCQRLESVLKGVEQDDRAKVVVLNGGYNFFSNGIHLNVIENAFDAANESWRNINAINDVVRQMFKSNKVTISALQGNAGAGGVMMALASDYVVCRKGVILNPHYRKMHLYGSEYHTYFLPRRVGAEKAHEILTSAQPLLASEAEEIGMFDLCEYENHKEFNKFVSSLATQMTNPLYLKEKLKMKNILRSNEWLEELENHRRRELSEMAKCFNSEQFHNSRKDFVYH